MKRKCVDCEKEYEDNDDVATCGLHYDDWIPECGRCWPCWCEFDFTSKENAKFDPMKAAILEWAKQNEYDHGLVFYSADEWKAKGETMGADSLMTFLIEGSPLQTIFGGHVGPELENKATEELNRILEQFDCWFELGYAWSVHVYPYYMDDAKVDAML